MLSFQLATETQNGPILTIGFWWSLYKNKFTLQYLISVRNIGTDKNKNCITNTNTPFIVLQIQLFLKCSNIYM